MEKFPPKIGYLNYAKKGIGANPICKGELNKDYIALAKEPRPNSFLQYLYIVFERESSAILKT